MTWFKKAVSPRNVSEGDLAEFTHGPNKGARVIVEDRCKTEAGTSSAFDSQHGCIWHIHPLQALNCITCHPWPDGYAAVAPAGYGDCPVHAKDRDLRKVPPEELDKADPRDVAAPRDEVVDAKIPVPLEH